MPIISAAAAPVYELSLTEPDRHRHGTVAGRIPSGEPRPSLAPRIERNRERMTAEGRQIRGRDHLGRGRLTIPVDDLDKIEREGPLDLTCITKF